MTKYTPHQCSLIDKHRDINVDYDWWVDTIANFAELTKKFGIEIETESARRGGRLNISFALHQQGAGANFKTEWFNVADVIAKGREIMSLPHDHDDAWIKTSESRVPMALRAVFERLEEKYGVQMLRASRADILGNVKVRGTNSRDWQNVEVEFDDDEDTTNADEDEPFMQELQAELEALMKDLVTDLARALYRDLDDEYDYQTDDEQVWESIVANELDTPEEVEEAA